MGIIIVDSLSFKSFFLFFIYCKQCLCLTIRETLKVLVIIKQIYGVYSAEKPGTYMQTMNLCPAGLDKHF